MAMPPIRIDAEFQSAPLTVARGDEDAASPVRSKGGFNPLP